MSIDYKKMSLKKIDEINKMIETFLPLSGKEVSDNEYTHRLPCDEKYLTSLFEAINYSVRAGGKRVRPLFMLECFLIFSEADPLKDEAYKVLAYFITAIELIHTYSLVHDDLPAMDNDMYRRGMLTTHAKYGEALGILAGDGLLNLAFETAAASYDTIKDINSCELYQRILKSLNILGKKSGIYGMAGGQAIDIGNNGKYTDIEELIIMYELKTAALLEASMMIGAVLAGADEDKVTLIGKAARNIGIAFQIQDDVLDVIGDEAVIGKPVNSDEKNKKTTYVTIYSIEEAKKESDRLSRLALNEISEITKDMPNEIERLFINEMIENLIYRKK